MDTTDNKVAAALGVIVKDRRINRFLRDNDPKALAQAEEALGIVPTDTEQKRIHSSIKRKLDLIDVSASGALQSLRNNDYAAVTDEVDTITERIEEIRGLVGDMLHAQRKGK